MKKFLSVFLLLGTLLCASCSSGARLTPESPTLPPNPFAEPSPQASPDLQPTSEAQNLTEAPAEIPHGIGFSIEPLNWDWRNEKLVYDGSPIKLDFKISGSGSGKINLGLMLFVNGFLQPHRLVQNSAGGALDTQEQSLSQLSTEAGMAFASDEQSFYFINPNDNSRPYRITLPDGQAEALSSVGNGLFILPLPGAEQAFFVATDPKNSELLPYRIELSDGSLEALEAYTKLSEEP